MKQTDFFFLIWKSLFRFGEVGLFYDAVIMRVGVEFALVDLIGIGRQVVLIFFDHFSVGLTGETVEIVVVGDWNQIEFLLVYISNSLVVFWGVPVDFPD